MQTQYDYSCFPKTSHVPQLLQNKIEAFDKQVDHFNESTYPTCALGIMGQSCLFINPSIFLGLLPTMILDLTYSVNANESIEIKDNAEILLNRYKEISNFIRVLKDFELSPLDEKVKNVFDHFVKINQDQKWNNFIKEHKLIHPNDLLLFGEMGSIFLMDIVSKSLKDKKVESAISQNWEHLLTLHYDEIIDQKEPWESIERINPELDVYHHFFSNREDFESANLSGTIVEIFENVIEKSLESKLV